MPETLERQSGKSTVQSKYRLLATQLRDQIQRHELQPGDRLPSFVELRAQYGATPTTVERVYGLLESEGLIERRQGSGTYVAERKRVLTGNIGFVGSSLTSPQKAPFQVHLQEGLHEAMKESRQRLLYIDVASSFDAECYENIDGLLLCNLENPWRILQALPPGFPCVSLLNVIDGIISVVVDDYRGVKTAVNRLLHLGHRRIACLMEESPSLARRRFAGYSDGMVEAGIDVAPGWVRLTEPASHAYKSQHYLQWGRHQMKLWLEEGFSESGCTALFVQNEMAAISVMQVLQEEGWKVPEDISVMGFDGTELCDYVVPRLTAMESPLAQVGATAVEMLNRQIAGETPQVQTLTLPVSLRDGDSVAPLLVGE